jgi:hypothetical protein
MGKETYHLEAGDLKLQSTVVAFPTKLGAATSLSPADVSFLFS